MEMVKRIHIEIMSGAEALKSVQDTWERASKGEKMQSRLAFGSMRELFASITEKRLELVRYIGAHPGLSIRQLSIQLGRDYKNVHTDVTALLDLDLLEKDDSGGIVAPWDEIVIHAAVKQSA